VGRQSEPLIMSTGLATCRISSYKVAVQVAPDNI
jgi:hypothetical protein